MFRLIATIAASLVFSPLQAAPAADIAEAERPSGSLLVSSSALRTQYERLKAELQRHRNLARAGGWPAVPDGPTMRPGSVDPRLGILARRLAASGDLADNKPASFYDVTLQDAVLGFQARHGLDTDGLVGRATLQALNVPIEHRIGQIQVNLERLGPLSDINEERFILVNIPAFEAYVVRDDKTVWTAKIIVGTTEDETPEFRSELKSVVFNPTWSVPYSIASKEMLPEIKQNPGFFEKGRYQLYDPEGNRVDPEKVDWSAVSARNFPYVLVQRPGPANQLGQVKFMIPNEYSVCMHDTPAKSLFKNASRAMSHGCIRLEQPLVFAELILDSEGWTREKIDAQIDSGHTRTVALSEPLAIYVIYLTAEVDDQGRIHFYEDIYGLDAGSLEALDRPLSSDHHVRPVDRQ